MSRFFWRPLSLLCSTYGRPVVVVRCWKNGTSRRSSLDVWLWIGMPLWWFHKLPTLFVLHWIPMKMIIVFRIDLTTSIVFEICRFKGKIKIAFEFNTIETQRIDVRDGFLSFIRICHLPPLLISDSNHDSLSDPAWLRNSIIDLTVSISENFRFFVLLNGGVRWLEGDMTGVEPTWSGAKW